MIGDKECLNCGQNLIDLPGKRKKVFCNSTCRSNYWQKSDRLEKEGKSIEEIVSILSKIAKNNKPENKKKIEEERAAIVVKVDARENPSTPEDCLDNSGLIAELKEKIKSIYSEKIPSERNTPIGKKVWELEQKKKISDIQEQINRLQ